MLNTEKLAVFCQQLLKDTQKSLVVAFSGGVDSHVLLHALVGLRDQAILPSVSALHINHHLNPKANVWAKHCRAVCQLLQVPCSVMDVEVLTQKSDGLEAAARKVRYQAFKDHVNTNQILLTAHHQDDQAETILLQLLRGAGLKGLSAMPSVKTLDQLTVARPLLTESQVSIMQYAKAHQLHWIEDDSNQDMQLQRNYLRHQVMPLLKARWPSCIQTMARSAEHCSEASDLLAHYAQQAGVFANETGLSVSSLCQLTLPEQKHHIRCWLVERGLPLPSSAKLNQICETLLPARQDAMPKVTWADVEARRFLQTLYIEKSLPAFDANASFHWDVTADLILPAKLGVLQAKPCQGLGFDRNQLTQGVTVKFRQGGEVCRIPGRAGSKTLKQLFQEWQVPPWLRDRVPLIYINEKLACIVGYAVCEGFEALDSSVEIVLSEQH